MWVRPIPGERLRYWVGSESRPGVSFAVDLGKFSANGSCTCEQFTIKLAGPASRYFKTGQSARCKHIEAARDYELDLRHIPAVVRDCYHCDYAEYDAQDT